MFEEIDILESLGLYKEADDLYKIILSNNFMLTKKKVNPQRRIDRRLDSIDSQLGGITNSLDENGGRKPTDDNIVVEPFKENDVEKLKFNIN
jgi:hypothetical protein